MTKEYSDYLAHHGIIGQKWGKRRYQNEDGTLTEAGKARYSKRKEDVESAKQYAKDKVEGSKKTLSYWNDEVKKAEAMPATKEGIKKYININDDDYDLYLDDHKTPEGIKKSIVRDNLREANSTKAYMRSWQKKLKSLEKVKVDAIMSNKQHRKQIEDIMIGEGPWLYKNLTALSLWSTMKDYQKKNRA